ncbi:vWA domain-containing protein [Fibrella forsythiae]|uniref:VWA domain-containing protein n=1 Tax=Fibrella forsythiae TaxID=2817061 RepID=A0ABS3JH80_9BACT|nr:VWA domain-containing protein [Fibrella forsythiae]MBO0948599.1 VWA domain-containing protein [Fibrella forsythiae]
MPWYAIHWLLPQTLRSFHYDNQWALWLIPLSVSLFVFRGILGRRYHQQLRVSMAGIVGPRPDIWMRVVSTLRFLLPLSVWLSFSFLLIALARPQIVRQLREEQSDGIDIVLALDISSSMTETDLRPNRLAAARQVAQAFVNGRRNDRIGLVVFAGEAYSLCPLTTDYTLLLQYIRELNPNMIRTTGTAIGDALARSINRLRDSPAKSKVLILLSDGDNTAGNLDPLTVARLAQNFGVKIYTIAVGKRTRLADTLGIATQFDEGILKTIASVGQGGFFRANDAGQLRQVFARIDKLERAPVRVQTYEDIQDQYRPYIYWGISFLLVALFLKNTVLGNSLED